MDTGHARELLEPLGGAFFTRGGGRVGGGVMNGGHRL